MPDYHIAIEYLFCSGVGHYDTVDEPELVTGDIEGEKIVHISSKADTVLAVSGNKHSSINEYFS